MCHMAGETEMKSPNPQDPRNTVRTPLEDEAWEVSYNHMTKASSSSLCKALGPEEHTGTFVSTKAGEGKQEWQWPWASAARVLGAQCRTAPVYFGFSEALVTSGFLLLPVIAADANTHTHTSTFLAIQSPWGEMPLAAPRPAFSSSSPALLPTFIATQQSICPLLGICCDSTHLSMGYSLVFLR